MSLLVAGLAAGCDRLGGGPGAEEREANYIAGQNFALQGQKDKAIASFEQAVLVNPSNAAAHLFLGDLYHDQHSFINAAYHYNRHQELLERRGQKPDVSAANRLKNCEMQLAVKYSKELSAEQNESAIEDLRRQLAEKNNVIQRLQAENLQRSTTNSTLPAVTETAARSTAPESASSAKTPVSPVQETINPAGQETSRNVAKTDKTRTANPVSASRTHTVKSGETPSLIARKYGVSVKALMAANPGLNPSKMKVGSVVRIPSP